MLKLEDTLYNWKMILFGLEIYKNNEEIKAESRKKW